MQLDTRATMELVLFIYSGLFLLLQLYRCIKIIIMNFNEVLDNWKMNLSYDDLLQLITISVIVKTYWHWIDLAFIKVWSFELHLKAKKNSLSEQITLNNSITRWK